MSGPESSDISELIKSFRAGKLFRSVRYGLFGVVTDY